MSTSPERSHVEAWKSLIDFLKSTMSLAAAILTALIGYYVVGGPEIMDSPMKYLPPALLVLSIVVAMYGTGRAIRSVKTGDSDRRGVLFTNVSVALLVAGVLTLPLIRDDNQLTMNDVLRGIANETSSKPGNFSFTPENVKSVEIKSDNYSVVYSDSNRIRTVVYSKDSRIVTSIQ